MEEQVKSSFWKVALIYGAIIGFVAILISLVFYFIGLYSKGWTDWVNTLISLVLVFYLMILYRKKYLGGYASFGQIFIMVLVSSGIISTIITVLFHYLLLVYIDPGLLDQVRITVEDSILNNPRIPESMYKELLGKLEKQSTVTYIIRTALISSLVLNVIISLLVAALIKKEEKINTPV